MHDTVDVAPADKDSLTPSYLASRISINGANNQRESTPREQTDTITLFNEGPRNAQVSIARNEDAPTIRPNSYESVEINFLDVFPGPAVFEGFQKVEELLSKLWSSGICILVEIQNERSPDGIKALVRELSTPFTSDVEDGCNGAFQLIEAHSVNLVADVYYSVKDDCVYFDALMRS
jgi:hypothetical protein